MMYNNDTASLIAILQSKIDDLQHQLHEKDAEIMFLRKELKGRDDGNFTQGEDDSSG